MKNRYLIMFLVGVLSFGSLEAQQGDNSSDAEKLESWNGLKVAYPFSKTVTFAAEAQLRLKSYGNTYSQAFLELQTIYEPFKSLELGLGYRNIDSYDDVGKNQGHENFHRYSAYMQGKMAIKRWDFNARIQHQTKREINDSSSKKNNSYWRTKLGFKYNIRNWKLDPRFAVEFFMQDRFDPQDSYNKFRASFGTRVNLKNKRNLVIKYLYEESVNKTNPSQYHVLSLRYGLSIKKAN